MVNKSNTTLTFKGAPLKTEGVCLKEGQKAPAFKLTGNDLGDITFANFAGKTVVLSVVPSVDTPTCSLQTKRFNDEGKKLQDQVVFLTVSMDLPFAQKRWSESSECSAMRTASDYKYRRFGQDYGIFLPDTGLLGRAVFVIDTNQNVRYVEYVTELSSEPDYDSALKAVAECIG